MRRIGIMGGTFNPIHNGHLAIAQSAKEQFTLDKVMFMPSGVPYMKKLREVLPASVRCEMTALAIRDIPYFELSDIEAVSAENTYTCNTLLKLKALYPDEDYYFILGADSLYAIEEWHRPELIFKNCTILAAVRNESVKSCSLQKDSKKPDDDCKEINLQRQLQAQAGYLREKYRASIELLETGDIDVSSTQIRELIKTGASVHGLVPDTVEAYILKNHLYRSQNCLKGGK